MENTNLSFTKSNHIVEEQESPRHEQVYASMDELFELIIGDFGVYQFIQSILVSLLSFLDAQQTFISVYTDMEPKWHCINSKMCNPSSNICHLPIIAWSWDEPSHKSIISEWSLQCSSSFIKGLPSTAFFTGCLVGGFVLSAIGDSSLGRKNMLFLSSLVMSTFGLLSAFSTNIWMYSGMRFASGLGRAAIISCALVLLMERSGKRWRGRLGVFVFIHFSFGILSLPAIAFTNRSSPWRALYIWTSAPSIVYIVVSYFFVNESPRWLIMQGQDMKAKKILARLASRNSNNIDLASIQLKQEPLDKSNLSIKSIFIKRWALRRILATMVIGLGAGMMYYGIVLGVVNLGFNTYLSITFNAALLIPSQLIILFVIEKMNRKISLLAFCVLSGSCSVVCALLGSSRKGIKIGLELVSFFSVSMVCNVLMIYAAELFPTCVRNSATSMIRQAILFGSVFVPTLVSAGKKNEFLSYGVIGLTILVCGMFVIILPETRGTRFCDTMEEQESKDKTVV